VLASLLMSLSRLVSWLRQRKGKSSAKLQITVSAMAETSSESQESTNSNPELGLRTDSNELSEKPTDLPKRNKF